MELCPKGGDYFLILLNSSFDQLSATSLGPYSRFGFNHPGPFVFYLYALLEPLWWWMGNEFMRHSFSQFFVNILLITSALRAVPKFTASWWPRLLFLLVILYLLIPSRAGVLFDIWGPSTLVCPLLAFITCGAAIAAGRHTFIFPWAFAATFALSNHLSSAQVIVPISLAICWILLRSKSERSAEHSRLELLSIGAGGVIAFLGVAPIIAEAFTQPHFGNVGKIIHFFLSPQGESSGSLLQSLEYVSSFFAAPLRFLGIPPYIIAGVILAVPWLRRIESSWERYLRTFVLISFLFAFVGALKIPGKMYQYLMMYMFSIAGVAWYLAISGIISRLMQSRGRLGYNRITSATAHSALIAALLFASYTHLPHFRESCGTKYEDVAKALNPTEQTLHEFTIKDLKLWGSLAGVIYHLTENGYSTCVPELWGFMFGSNRVCTNPSFAPQAQERRSFTMYFPRQLPHPPPHAVMGRGFTIVEEQAIDYPKLTQ